jgi:hypothetical protein
MTLMFSAHIDSKAVSKFTPSPANTVIITPKSSDEILIVGLRKDEVNLWVGSLVHFDVGN